MSDPYVESLRRGFKSRTIPGSCTIVIFGATGDLTHRKLIPALYNLYIPVVQQVSFIRLAKAS